MAFWALTTTAQTRPPRPLDQSETLNYGFVSPNTRENLKLEEAIRSLNSDEEKNLIKKANDLGCRTRTRLLALRALGSWSDGAEHSVLLRMISDEQTVRYLLSVLGKDARQKSVLYFHQQKGGPARIYILYPRNQSKGFSGLAKALDEAGIAFRTLVPVKSRMLVYIADAKGELLANVTTAAKRLGARVRSETGRTVFIGDDDDRQKGRVAFDEEIKGYESRNPRLPASCRN